MSRAPTSDSPDATSTTTVTVDVDSTMDSRPSKRPRLAPKLVDPTNVRRAIPPIVPAFDKPPSNHVRPCIPLLKPPDFGLMSSTTTPRSVGLSANSPATKTVRSGRLDAHPIIAEPPVQSVQQQMRLRPPPPPPALPATPAKSKSTLVSLTAPSRNSPVKRPRIPPMPLVSDKTRPATPLRALQPPPPPVTPARLLHDMKPISETHIAQSVNPMSEGGSTDLFSLALKAKGEDDIIWVSPEERELGRGLVVSPEKATKGKGGKYIRGRLADNAARRFASERTVGRLWETQLARRLAVPNVRPAPDLCLRVRTILHATASSATLARCVLISATVPLPRPKPKRIFIPFGTQDMSVPEEDERWVLFRVDDPKSGVEKVVREGLESRRAFVMAAAAVTVVHDSRDKLPIYPRAGSEILLQETPSELERQIGVARQAVTSTYFDSHARVQEVVSRWIGVEQAVERRVKSFIAPDEPLTPGVLYVGVATLTGSILARNRFLFTRLVLPPTLFFLSLNHFLPKASSNLSEYFGSLEEAYFPTLAQKHAVANAHTLMTWEMAKDATRDGREKISAGVVSVIGKVQEATGLKLREGLGLATGKAEVVRELVDAKVEEVKVVAEKKVEEVTEEAKRSV
ncbi:hypothetical protein EUX98_g8577 [Antrodiella citrinella]|uniref:MICOS complex subunit n=1 Tax=Antrodiella citrinella TaxID=2447956 RepID=A0A4S4M5L9_9APHY|nr:hypothetical protein EUX98_g8577 [Antrodiella citrinella]